MNIPEDAKLVLMSGDENGGHKFEFLSDVSQLPDGASYDNWLQIDDRGYEVYATPTAPAFGATFALILWAEELE